MPDYRVKFETVTIGGTDYVIRPLLDLQQYSDSGETALAGISPVSRPLFGHLWPSARDLAKAKNAFDLEGKRILEIGAGRLALSRLVIRSRFQEPVQ